MLNLMMTTLVWILSMGLFQFSWIHHTFQQSFASLTPAFMESMVSFTVNGETWQAGFDASLVDRTLFPYFEANVENLSSSYSLMYELYEAGQPCSTLCSVMVIELEYVNGGKLWNMSRSFQLYAIGS
jgi:hypothetical protein